MGKASRRKTKNRSQELAEATRSKLEAMGINPGMLVRTDLPQEQKISNALSKMLEDEVENKYSLDEYRHHLNAIVLAWNLSLLQQEEQAKMLRGLSDFANKTDPSMAQESQALVLRLIEKKQAMFPDDKRYIISHEVRFEGNMVFVSAAALTAPSHANSA